MSEQTLYYLAFSHCLGIGPIKFDLLLKEFVTPKKAYEAEFPTLKKILGPITATKFSEFRNSFDPVKKWQEIAGKDMVVLTREDRRFPNPLREISDVPICLYVKGDVGIYDFEKDICISIVGTRMPTSYGQRVARKFAMELADRDCVIVSGMAMGIDTVAHQSVLDMKGRTIAVLGSGVDIIYPSVNRKLYHDIIQNRGLVMSEFPPGMTTLPGLFVARNRLISGLSRGVLVAEGLKDSGSLITARCAAEQGKEVFAPPAPITSSLSAAPNLLLKEGAKIVTSVEDITNEFNLQLSAESSNNSSHLSMDETIVFNQLLMEPLASDELVIRSKLAIYQVLPILSTLELKGIVEKNIEGKYQIKN